MAMTRKALKAMGLTEEQVDSIIEMHTETVDGLKERLKSAEENAGKLEGVQKELDALKAGGDYKAKFEAEAKAFADYKKSVEAEKTLAAKEAAVRAYLSGKSITGANQEIAIRGMKDEIAAVELDGTGGIKESSALDALVSGTYSGLVAKTTTRGANPANPPRGGGVAVTKEEIYKRGADGRYVYDTETRQRMLTDSPGLII